MAQRETDRQEKSGGKLKTPGRLPYGHTHRIREILLRVMRGRPHGDRLDKAGQPGGSVSAVYSPAAALRHVGHAQGEGPTTASDRTAGPKPRPVRRRDGG
jgi:hypothetical protein